MISERPGAVQGAHFARRSGPWTWFTGKPEEYQGFREQATNAWVMGQRRNAEALARQGAGLAQKQKLGNAAVGLLAPIALNNALVEDCAAARKVASSAAVLVICGDRAALEKIAQAARSAPPTDTGAEYIVALADLREKKGPEAEAGCQKISSHKYNWGPYYAPSFVGLARAAALAGDTVKAKKGVPGFPRAMEGR